MSKDTHNELPSCIDFVESIIDYLPTEEDIEKMKSLEEDGKYEELHEMAKKLNSYISNAECELSNIIYFTTKDED
jgi:hypothetical protein